MDFQKLYQEKLTTPQQAVSLIRSGDWVDYGWCVCTPRTLDKALAARYEELTDVKVRGGVLFEKPAIMQVPDVAEHFTWNSWHMSGVERKMIAEGSCFYIPLRYSEMPGHYRRYLKPVQVAMFQVAPMDEFGYFNFGPSISHMRALCEVADAVIVEVNQNMPRCLGGFEESIHISDVTYVVEGENPPMWTLGASPATPVDYTNDVRVVAQLDNFISINNAVDVDLFGQVNAESSGVRHISGAGGQLDFVLGAYLSKGGKSFICCSSTMKGKDGTLTSRIRPTLREGSIVTDTRSNLHYLVTEYGIVNLKGLATWQRAEAIIGIAHPDFREELIRQAEAMGIWRKSNKR